MKRILAGGGTAFCLLLVPLVADAAALRDVKGKVFVSSGRGYVPAVEGMELKNGDSVIANPGAQANVVCSEGAITTVRPGAVLTINQSVCDPQAAIDGASGEAAAAGGLAQVGASGLVVGAVAVAGAVGIVTAASRNKDRPASP